MPERTYVQIAEALTRARAAGDAKAAKTNMGHAYRKTNGAYDQHAVETATRVFMKTGSLPRFVSSGVEREKAEGIRKARQAFVRPEIGRVLHRRQSAVVTP